MNSSGKKSASKVNKLEKLKNALHPITSKKIEVVYTAADNCLFYISPNMDYDNSAKKSSYNGEHDESVQNKEYIITADEFREIYLRSIGDEIEDLSSSVTGQVNHLNNHRDEQQINLQSDMSYIEKHLIEAVKLICKKYTIALTKRYQEDVAINQDPLNELKASVDEMQADGKSLIEELSDLIQNEENFEDENKQKVLDNVAKVQNYSEKIDEIKKLSENSFDDLVPNYVLSEQDRDSRTEEIRSNLQSVFENKFSQDEFLKEIMLKPNVRVSPVDCVKSVQVWEATDYKELCKTKLKLIGCQEISSHPSFHTLSGFNLDNKFFITGHSDSTFKIWEFNQDYFVTPTKNATKRIRIDDFQNPDKKEKPFSLVYTSNSQKFHKNFVSAITGYDRKRDLRTVLCTGDSMGNMIVSYLQHNRRSLKIQKVEQYYSVKGAHSAAITRMERYKFTDIVVTTGADSKVSFWDVYDKCKVTNSRVEHDLPIQNFQFADNYNYLCTICLAKINIWRILPAKKLDDGSTIVEGQDGYDIPMFEETLGKTSINVTLEKRITLEDFGPQYNSIRIYNTNFTSDFILFMTAGSDIRQLNLITGDYIGEIEGANFRGTTNIGIISDESSTSTLRNVLDRINTKFVNDDGFRVTDGQYKEEETDDEDPLFGLFVEQLNHYLLYTNSNKDKFKMWRFHNGISKHHSSEAGLGGLLDNVLTFVPTRDRKLALISTGMSSNKLEVLLLK